MFHQSLKFDILESQRLFDIREWGGEGRDCRIYRISKIGRHLGIGWVILQNQLISARFVKQVGIFHTV